MKVEIRIDGSCREPKVVVLAAQMTDEVRAIAARVSGEAPPFLAGFRGDTVEILEQADVLRVYTAAGKVYAATQNGEYGLRLRLYELEARLDGSCFARISNSEIINLKKARGFDLSITGTIRVTLSDGTVTYVSRRYVTRIKQILGI